MTSPLEDIFDELTERQHEALAGIADNLTSKEIAAKLGVSTSAINQRIESVRHRLGSPPRARLAREYRQLAKAETCTPITGDSIQVPNDWPMPESSRSGQNEAVLRFSDSMDFPIEGSWRNEVEPRIVPRWLDGKFANMGRGLAIIAMALGLLMFALVALGVANAISDLAEQVS